jgi:hypothetical protein
VVIPPFELLPESVPVTPELPPLLPELAPLLPELAPLLPELVPLLPELAPPELLDELEASEPCSDVGLHAMRTVDARKPRSDVAGRPERPFLSIIVLLLSQIFDAKQAA